MKEITVNENGVPQYPRGHAGRLFVALGAVATLKRPTAASVANLTGLAKGSVDRLVMVDLRYQLGVDVAKDGPVYHVESWGDVIKPEGVKKCLTVPMNGTIMGALVR